MAKVLGQRIGNTASSVNYLYNSSFPVLNVPFKVMSPYNILPAQVTAYVRHFSMPVIN